MFKKSETALGWLGILLTVWVILQSSKWDAMPMWLDKAMGITSWVIILLALVVSIRLIFISRSKAPSAEITAINELSNKIDNRFAKLINSIDNLTKEIRADREKRNDRQNNQD